MIEDIEKIIKIFESAKISKLDLELENMKLKLEKDDVIYKAAPSTEADEKQATKDDSYHVTSPVVGTFYMQRSEKNPPFVTVGQKVKKGDPLCIIEAMKVMNEVTSPVDGVVLSILPHNEELVEYGQDLVLIGESHD